MAEPGTEQVYYAARKLKPYLKQELQDRLAILLNQVEEPGKTDAQIIDLLANDEFARQWIWRALFGPEEETLSQSYMAPAGNSGPIPSSSIWVCPKCSFDYRVAKSGQPVPPCPEHGIHLLPASSRRKRNKKRC